MSMSQVQSEIATTMQHLGEAREHAENGLQHLSLACEAAEQLRNESEGTIGTAAISNTMSSLYQKAQTEVHNFYNKLDNVETNFKNIHAEAVKGADEIAKFAM